MEHLNKKSVNLLKDSPKVQKVKSLKKRKILGKSTSGRILKRPLALESSSEDPVPNVKKCIKGFGKNLENLRHLTKKNMDRNQNSSSDNDVTESPSKMKSQSKPITMMQVEAFLKARGLAISSEKNTEDEEEIIVENGAKIVNLNEQIIEPHGQSVASSPEPIGQLIDVLCPLPITVQSQKRQLIAEYKANETKGVETDSVAEMLRANTENLNVQIIEPHAQSVASSPEPIGQLIDVLCPLPITVQSQKRQLKDLIAEYKANETKDLETDSVAERLRRVENNQVLVIELLLGMNKKLNVPCVSGSSQSLLQPLKGFPITTLESLKDLEGEEKDEIRKSLKAHLKDIGAVNARSFVRMSMFRIMTTEVMNGITWFGQLGQYKLSDTKVANIIYEAALDLKLYQKGQGAKSLFSFDIREILRGAKQSYRKLSLAQ